MDAGSIKRTILRPRSWLATLLAVAAGFLLYNWMQDRPSPEPIVFRDAAAPKQLWKPEPGLLLEHGEQIGLTPEQEREVAELDAAWMREKQGLERLMEAVIRERELEDGNAESHQEIAQGLAGYSELSREYDFRREAFWRTALELLDDDQVKLLEAVQ